MQSTDDSLPPAGPSFRDALDRLVNAFDAHKIRYAIIGGVAVLQHGRVRTTDDIDALLLLPQLQMARFFESLVQEGFTLDVARCIAELRGGMTSFRFGHVVIDLLHPVIPAYHRVLDRADGRSINGRTVQVASVEGLIVTKLMAMRPQDEADIRDLLVAQAGALDLDFIRGEMESFMPADDPRREHFERWVREATAAT